QFFSRSVGEGGNPLSRVGHRMRDHQILNAVTIQEFPKHGKRHRHLPSEPQARTLLKGRSMLRGRRRFNYALVRGWGVSEISEPGWRLTQNEKKNARQKPSTAGAEGSVLD